ncbi:MAG: 2'-5' RNA ligase family protein [Erysipelotrichaceae bacterium]|nr:2'-5' RNA ligase family protein [Erysipelotrichaceae bacterium]
MEYVLQFGFDIKSQKKIQKIKNYLRLKGIVDKQRGWFPHITLNLYQIDDLDKFIEIIDKFVGNISSFEVICSSLGNFRQETLFINPNSKEDFESIKNIFDKKLKKYVIPDDRPYSPHITVCTNSMFEKSEELTRKKFKKMKVNVCKIWLFDEKVNLIKEWKLKR